MPLPNRGVLSAAFCITLIELQAHRDALVQNNTVNWLISILSNSVGDEICMGFLALESSVGEPFEDGTDHIT